MVSDPIYLFARVRGSKCASTKKTSALGESVFFISPQTRELLQGNACRYDRMASGGLLGGLNLYLYANAAPTMYTDPLGLAPQYCGTCATTECLLRGGNLCDPGYNPRPPPSCDGEWEQLGSYFLPGRAETFVCKCSWTCKKCNGSYAGGRVDTLGVPAAQGGYTADWEGRGSSAKQRFDYGSPTQCICKPPTPNKKKCDQCEKP